MTAPVRTTETMVKVELGDRAYDIAIGRGLLASLGARVGALKPGAKAAIVTDETVAKHYLAPAISALAASDIAATPIVVPPGEASKCFATLERVCDALLAAKIERGDVVIALGGGVVGDLAGFAAAVIRRGIDYVQVPTTLAGAGRFVGRREDRDRFPLREEPDWRLLSADLGRSRHGIAGHPQRA